MRFFAVVVDRVEVDDVVGKDINTDILEEGANVDEVIGGIADVEARLGEADDVNATVDTGCGECLNSTADEPDFPFIRLDIRAVAGRDPNDLTLLFLTTGVVVGNDETGAEASLIKPKFKEDSVMGIDIWQEMFV